MRKRTKFKSLLLDLFVVSACLFAAAYFFWIFWVDLYTSKNRADKESIASVEYRNRISQRKSDDRVVWERLDVATTLYDGDLIRTENLADTKLDFWNGTSLSIYENTMLYVHRTAEDELRITLSSGSISMDASEGGKTSLVLDDGSIVSMEGGTSLSTKSGSNGSRSIEVTNGSASFKSKEGENTSIISGESVSVQSNGSFKKNSVTVKNPPEMRMLNVEGGTVPVKIEWNNSDSSAAETVVIQTSYKKDFSVIAEERTVKGAKDSVLNLADGTVFWRVFPKDREEEASQGKISVLPVDPVTLLSPSASAVFYYRDRNPELNFSWNANNYASHYLLKVSSSADMSLPIVEKKVTASSLSIESLGSGEWWWQVIPYYEMDSIGYAGESVVSSFSIEKADALSPPELTMPLDNANVFYNETMDVNFVWKSQVKNASYDLLISDTQDFSNIIVQKTTNAKNIKVNLPLPERDEKAYYWKVVRKSDSIDDMEPESKVRTFNANKYISVGVKLLYPPEEYQAEEEKVTATSFVWKLPDKNREDESVLQISSNPDFTNIAIEEKAEKQKIENMKLPEGEWWWRVAAVNASGQQTETSEARHIIVLKELEAPEFVDIKNNEEILVPSGENLTLKWKPVPGADFYNVKIFDSDNKLVSEIPAEKDTKISVDVADQSYTCRVQAVAAQTGVSALRTSPVEAVEFSVRTASPVIATQPVQNTQIDGLTAFRKATVFKWVDGDDKQVSYEFVLKRRNANGTYKTVERIKSTRNTISIPEIKAGNYVWQVLANTSDGVSLNSREMNFYVSEIPALEQPLLISPENNFVMNSEYLRKNRSIAFEWNEVPEATGYTFVLYKKNRDGSLVSVYSEKNIKSTKINIRKLSILDIGQFTWTVTAHCLTKDGVKERPDAITSRNFEINFAVPSEIETVDTGTMYGE